MPVKIIDYENCETENPFGLGNGELILVIKIWQLYDKIEKCGN